MEQCEHREGVAERLVYHVPEMENLLGSGKEEHPLG